MLIILIVIIIKHWVPEKLPWVSYYPRYFSNSHINCTTWELYPDFRVQKMRLGMFCLVWDQSQRVECGKGVSLTLDPKICYYNIVCPENNESMGEQPHAQEQPWLFLMLKNQNIIRKLRSKSSQSRTEKTAFCHCYVTARCDLYSSAIIHIVIHNISWHLLSWVREDFLKEGK